MDERPALPSGKLLTRREVCRELDVSAKTLERMIRQGQFSRPRQLGKRKPRWCEADIVVYRYRAIRGDFDPIDPDAPLDLGEDDDE